MNEENVPTRNSFHVKFDSVIQILYKFNYFPKYHSCHKIFTIAEVVYHGHIKLYGISINYYLLFQKMILVTTFTSLKEIYYRKLIPAKVKNPEHRHEPIDK